MSPTLTRAGVIAGLAIAVVSAPAAALATSAHHHQVSTHPRHGLSHRPSKAVHAIVHGLVVSRQNNQLTVLAHTAKIGAHTVHNQIEHLTLAATRRVHPARTVRAGYRIAVSGQAVNGVIVNATVQSSSPRPAEVAIGTINAVDGNLVSICVLDTADGSQGGPADNGDQSGGGQGGNGDQGSVQSAAVSPAARSTDATASGCSGENSQGQVLIADLSAATFSGAAGTPADLVTGQYVVTLGEQSDGTFTAADVVAYASEPAFIAGQVTAADQAANTLTVAADGGDDNEDTSGSGTQVDTSNALVVVNGAADGSFPVAGDETLIVGADGSAATAQSGAPLTASVVYDFNANDTQPADDGGDNSGDNSGG